MSRRASISSRMSRRYSSSRKMTTSGDGGGGGGNSDAHTIRITVVGDGYTGKTSLLIGYKDKVFDEKYIPTVFDSYSMKIPINNKIYKIILQDTAGQEDYDKLRPLGYTTTDVFVICYSIDRVESFKHVRTKWAKEVRHYRPHCQIILAATKVDQRGKMQTTTFDDGLRLQQEIKAEEFIECSAKELYNIDKVFNSALLAYINKKPIKKRQFSCLIL